MSSVKGDILVIGGGIIGSACAYYLARRGLDVVVVERGFLCSGTSGACDGLVFMQTKQPGIHLDLAQASARLYEGLSEEIGRDCSYRRLGGIIVDRSELEREALQEFRDQQRASGLQLEMVDREQALEAVPVLSPDITGGSYSPLDGKVDPLVATQALAYGAEKHGARFVFNTEVKGFEVRGGRVEAVETTNGRFSVGGVVAAAGVWSPFLGEMLGIKVPIEPVKGQLIVTVPVGNLFPHVLFDSRYIAMKYNPDLMEGTVSEEARKLGVAFGVEQSAGGNLLIGNSREKTGYERSTSPRVLSLMAKSAVELVPGLAGVPFLRTFAGLRPNTPDQLPIIGPAPGLDNFWVATGHGGDGISLAPITGHLVSQLVVGEEPDIDVEPLRVTRFMD